MSFGDLAHIGHVELYTPELERSARFFTEALGMEQSAAEGQSVYLRGYGDYQRYSVKLTEAPESGIGHMAIRARDPEALERRVAAVEASGHGVGWIDGDVGHGPAYRFHDPDGHLFELYYETERYEPPGDLRPVLKNQPMRFTGRGVGISRLDHVNLLAADVTPCREFAVDVLGFRHFEGIVLDDGTEAGAWLSLTIAAHELIYVVDARSARGRLHHVSLWVNTREEVLRAADLLIEHHVPIEFAPAKHTISQGFFLYVFEPGGNRIEITTGGYFVYDPDREPVIWSETERKRGQAWENETVESFHYYGTPPVTDEDRAYAARRIEFVV